MFLLPSTWTSTSVLSGSSGWSGSTSTSADSPPWSRRSSRMKVSHWTVRASFPPSLTSLLARTSFPARPQPGDRWGGHRADGEGERRDCDQLRLGQLGRRGEGDPTVLLLRQGPAQRLLLPQDRGGRLLPRAYGAQRPAPRKAGEHGTVVEAVAPEGEDSGFKSRQLNHCAFYWGRVSSYVIVNKGPNPFSSDRRLPSFISLLSHSKSGHVKTDHDATDMLTFARET